MPARRRFRGGGAGSRPTTVNGATKPAISAAHGGHAHKGAHGAPQATVTATLGGTTSSASAGHDQSGGGIGMAMLPFGMVALDRWAAKKGKRKTKGARRRRMRGGTNCTSCIGCGTQGGGKRRRRTRRRTRHRRRRTRHHRRTRYHRRRR